MAISVKVGGTRSKTVVSAREQSIATVSTASAIKIGNLEDNVGNIDTGSGLQTGQTIVYNTTTGKWVATSFDAEVDERVDEVIDTKVSAAIAGSDVDFDGGTY
jgi:hypothetical protein